MKIKNRMLAISLTASLLPLTVMGFFSYQVLQKAYVGVFRTQIEGAANAVHSRLEGIVNSNLAALGMVTSRTQLRGSLRDYVDTGQAGTQRQVARIINDACSAMERCEEMMVVATDGRVAVSTDPSSEGGDRSRTDYFVRGLRANVVDSFFRDDQGRPMLWLAGPMYLEERLLGVAAIRAGAGEIVSAMREYVLPGEGTIEIATRDGSGRWRQLLAMPPGGGEAWLSGQWSALVEQAMGGKELARPRLVDINNRSILAAPHAIAHTKWVMLARVDEAASQAPFRKFEYLFLFIFLLSAVLVITAVLYLTGTISRPLSQLADAARKISDGDVSVRAMTDCDDEIGFLGCCFNRMVESLEKKSGEIKKSEQIFRAVFDNARDGILLADLKSKRFFAGNRQICEMLGYSPEEIVRLGITDIHPADSLSHVLNQFERQARGEIAIAEELPVLRKDSTVFYADVNSAPVTISDHLYMIGVFRDVTGRRQAEAERKKLEQQLRQSHKMEAVGQLAGGIAHDFNNILTVIIGAATFLTEDVAEDDPKMDDVHQILTAAERAAKLTQGLLAFSRKQVVTLEPVKINNIVRDTGKLLRKLIGEDVELETVLAEEDPTIMADPGQLDQIFINLAVNGRDAMPDGGRLTISTAVVMLGREFEAARGYGRRGRYLLLSVADNGVGMDEQTRMKIFEPFFTTKERGRGTGMGMATVYGIVKQNEGYIEVRSRPGEGTTFQIYWPLCTAEEKLPVAVVEEVMRGSETLLVVEDDLPILSLISRQLIQAGYRVITASDGLEALAEFERNRERIDMLLLDVIMPGKNGWQVYREIKKSCPRMKVLFMSGYPFDFIKQKTEMPANYNYMAKPIVARILLGKIRGILDDGGGRQ